MSEDDIPKNPDDELADSWASALEDQDKSGTTEKKKMDPNSFMAEVHRADLEELEEESDVMSQDGPNLDVILDIPVTLSMEVGNTDISIRNLLQLNQGSIVELDRLAGEALDVMVNGTLIAHGEVVVVNEKFGIRLTDIVSPSERIRKLK
ncbi:MAG: flagellar motor switch protein FliN [Pseudomonadota bacterium]